MSIAPWRVLDPIFINRSRLMVLIPIILLNQRVDIANASEHKVSPRRILLAGSLVGHSWAHLSLSIFSRMLLITKSHHESDEMMLPDRENTRRMSLCKESVSPWTGASQFLATTQKIIQFSNGREPKVDVCCFVAEKIRPSIRQSRKRTTQYETFNFDFSTSVA